MQLLIEGGNRQGRSQRRERERERERERVWLAVVGLLARAIGNRHLERVPRWVSRRQLPWRVTLKQAKERPALNAKVDRRNTM